MPTARFCALIGVPERSWRRHQARAKALRPVKGPWPRPARTRVREAVRAHALAHPAWGHRKVWAMVRHDGHAVSQATILRLLTEPTGPMPASGSWTSPEFETTSGGTWRLAGCRDYWSKYARRFHLSPTANTRDACQRGRARPDRGRPAARPAAGRPV